MLRLTKGPTSIGRDDFINAIAENEAAVEHRDLRLGQRRHVPIQIHERVAFDAVNHYLNHKRVESQALPNSPAFFTVSKATIGTSATALSFNINLMRPTSWPACSGAPNGSLRASMGLILSTCPRGTVI